MTDTSATSTAVVGVKSAWSSKINWTQAIGIGASALVFMTGGKVNIPLEVQGEIVLAIQGAQGVVTWVMKTWFTPTVTAASVKS